jgi:hypothetical protein
MLRNYRVATQLVGSRVVLSSIEKVTFEIVEEIILGYFKVIYIFVYYGWVM